MRSLALALLIALLACAPAARQRDYSRLVAADPRAILIVPVVNKSVEVDAPDYFLSALPVPLAERGYYVFPVNLVKRVLEDDGLADASMVHDADPIRLCSIFGADAVLYATIEQWTARYVLLSTITTVEFSYLLKDCKTGAELWSGHHALRHDSSAGQQGLLVAALLAAVEKSKPSYMPMARRANSDALAFPGPGLPAGPYRPEHGHDLEPAARPASIH